MHKTSVAKNDDFMTFSSAFGNGEETRHIYVPLYLIDILVHEQAIGVTLCCYFLKRRDLEGCDM